MKILLFTPTYRNASGELAMCVETRASLEALLKHGHEVEQVVSVDEAPDRKNNIFLQYERAWKRANDGDYDALMLVEHDMIIPSDAIQKLASTDGDVIYGVYLFRESGFLNAFSLNADTAFFDRSLDNHRTEREQAFQAGVWDVCGAGFGCTFIHRRVFSSTPPRKPRGGCFPDLPFAQDCKAKGFHQVARFDVRCGHIRPDGFILWPNPDGSGWTPYNQTITVKSDFVGVINGRNVRFKKGQVRDVPAELVGGWTFLGLVDSGNYRI